MTRVRSFGAIFAGALAWAAVTACNQQTIQTPLRSFDRPSDVALTCAHYDPNSGRFNVRNLSDCTPLTAASLGINPATPVAASYIAPLGPNPPYTPFVLALVPQSARGELALVDTVQNKTLDADPLKPGFGFLPVGKLPEHVRATNDGCLAVTTNADSCDYGVVDISTMINRSQLELPSADMSGSQPITDVAVGVRRIHATVKIGTDAGGKDILRTLGARPAWVEMAPASDGAPATHGFEPGGMPGQCTGGVHKAWVALPGCQLVVKMQIDQDPARANVEKAIRVTQSGATEVTDLSTLDCPVECVGNALDMGGSLPPPPDLAGTPSDMGPPAPTQAFPGTLAIDVERDVNGAKTGGRLIIGDQHSERIDIVPFAAGGALGTARHVQLEKGALGVRIVRASPRSEAGKFLYAIARDGTIRVVDLDREVECETNPDPRFASGAINLQQTPTSTPALPDDPLTNARRLGCFPLGDPSTPPRSSLAISPGISLAQGQLPADVAFVHLDAPPGSSTTAVAPPSAGPGLLVGDFAWIVTSDGKGALVNIFDACPAPNQQDETRPNGPFSRVCDLANVPTSNLQTRVKYGHPEAMLLDRVSHRLRPGYLRFATPTTPSDPGGQPRVPDPFNPCATAIPSTTVSNIPDAGVPDAGSVSCLTSPQLPGLHDEPVPDVLFTTDTTISNQELVKSRVVKFVDPDHARNETWVASWEGVLPGSDRSLGAAFVQSSVGYLSDPGGTWCYRGARAGDKLIFKGCSVDSECNQAASFKCVHDPGAFADVQQGMCLHIDNKDTVESWPARCGKLLRSQRKFRIGRAQQGAKIPGGSGTTDLLTLQEIYEPEYRAEGLPDDKNCVSNDECAAITVVPSVGGTPRATRCLPDYDGRRRCILPCTDPGSDAECGRDFECYQSQLGDNRCMRAPIDPTLWNTCMSQLQNYELRVGESFIMVGTGSGHLVSEVPDPSQGGECIVTPQSSEEVRLRQSRVPLTTPAKCPGSALDSIGPGSSLGQTNICMLDGPAGMDRLIHFENPIFNIAVRIPKNGTQPIVPPDGTTISMILTGGGQLLLTLLGIDVEAQQPRAVVVAPDGQTVYVVDEGKSTSAAGLRGQLLRLFTPTQAIDNQFVVR